MTLRIVHRRELSQEDLLERKGGKEREGEGRERGVESIPSGIDRHGAYMMTSYGTVLHAYVTQLV